MQSTLDPKPTDDPHDFLVVPPDAVRVVPTDEELSNLLREAARHHSAPQAQAGSDLAAGPPVPTVDATFRAAAVSDVLVQGRRRSIGRRVLRGFTALLLAACIGAAAIAWQSQGDAARQMLASWAPQLALTSTLPPEQAGPSAQPAPAAVEAAAADTAPPQPIPPAQTAAVESVAPAAASADPSQPLQSMARDLASAGQEIEQLKASIEQLKAGQQQMSRDLARVSEARASEARTSEVRTSEVRASEVRASEQSARPRISKLAAAPPRPAAARVRKPMPIPPAQAAAAPILPQSPAPYYAPYAPRQIEPQPQATAQPEPDPELSSVPRPPMPVR
jgi:hypothetical protein